MSEISKRLAALPPDKREALVRRLQQERGESAGPVGIPKRARAEGAIDPLSFAQQRMWFLDRLNPNSALYNEALLVLRFEGDLQITALEKSLSEIIKRHEVLRSTYSEQDGQPVQVMHAPNDMSLPVLDYTHLPEAEREPAAQAFVQQEARQPFDLAKGPLVRMQLLRLQADVHLLLLARHHIVSDGESAGVLLHELSTLYDAFAKGQPSPLPELPIGYSDYAAWASQQMQGEALQADLAYWKQQLAGPLPIVEMPGDRQRPKVQTMHGETKWFHLPATELAPLKKLAQAEGTSLFTVLLAAFNTLLYRYTGLEDVIVGTPVSNRNRTELKGLIGFFVNTLVLRNDLSGNPTFQELLGRVKQVVQDGFSHQELPLEKLVEELNPQRMNSHSPLFQILFVLQDQPTLPTFSGLQTTAQMEETGVARFDMTCSLIEQADGMQVKWQYATDLYSGAWIERLFAHFQTLLTAIADDPNQRIATCPMLTEAERAQVLIEWNQTAVDVADDRTLPELFEMQVCQTPDAPAIAYEGTKLSYRELNERANALAHHLQSRGVGADVCVGLCMERSLEMIVGLLAVLKAGGAYVPLDPKLPPERLRLLLGESGAPILLTQPHLQKTLPELEVQVITLDAGAHAWAGNATENPVRATNAAHLAYVIFTSGSTGLPKGVQVEHRNIVHYTLAVAERLGMEAGDQFAMVLPLAVDSCKTVLFPSLLLGGCLHLISEDRALDARALAETFAVERIDWMKIAPTHMLALQQLTGAAPIMPRKGLVLGGEASRWEWVQQLRQAAPPGGQVFNHYGPTETAVGVLTYRVDAEAEGAAYTMTPLGRPLRNTELYVLDAHQQPVPVGVPGELCIGGRGVTRGYLHRSDLTAEKFIPHPFQKASGQKVYRTGDLVRYLPDGTLEFLGRIDDQVKIRGFRVELGEIQAVLAKHEQVVEAALLAREEESGQKRLVAYVVTQEGANGDDALAGTLRQYLAERVPDYMVPEAIVVLEQMPRNRHGKIDRAALPQPGWSTGAEEREEAPRTQAEELLAGIYATVLGKSSVGAHAHFFELGGHSLLATQVISRIRKTFDVELPVRALFDAPTVKGLAAVIEATLRDGQTLQAPPIQRVDRAGDLPLSFAQQRLWFLHQLEPNSPHFNMPFALRLQGQLDMAALETSLQAMIHRHESLRTQFVVREDGQPIQQVLENVNVSLARFDLCSEPVEARETIARRVLTAESCFVFDLSCAPLLRPSLLQMSEEDHVLLLTVHHIISDGWSNGIMLREWMTLYEAERTESAVTLPERTIQYTDFAVWQQEWLTGDVLAEQLDYWTTQLRGAPPLLELPTDHPRPAVQSYRGATVQTVIPHALTERLQSLSRKHGVTLYMTMLAAFGTLLHRYTGADDILIGSPIAGRNRAEIEDVVGFFINTLVMRTDLSDNPTFPALLTRVRDVTLEAYAHQDLPFEKLVEKLNPERTLNYNPIYQVAFTLQQDTGAQIDWPDLTVTPFALDWTTSKVDLSLVVVQQANAMTAVIEYSTDLFDKTTMERWLGHFLQLLEAITVEDTRPISQLPILSPAERDQVLQISRGDSSQPWPDACIHTLFEQQAALHPDHLAVIFEQTTLTYRELNQQANLLARHLQTQGVGRHDLVGICLERSAECVVAILAVLKTGGTYVPMDPALPNERLAFMVEDARVKWIVTEEKQRQVLPVNKAELVLIERVIKTSTGAESVENLDVAVHPDDPAYLIFTSGSTGRPNGLLVRHRGVPNVTQAVIREFGITEHTRVGQFATLSFDASVYQMFMALHAGATLCVVSRTAQLSVEAFAQFARETGMEVADLPPVLLDQLRPEDVPQLRTVATGGERCSLKVAERWSAERNFYNVYGPTETTIATAYERVNGVDEQSRNIPIGRPMPHTQLYILDQERQPVPLGIPGELYIGGVGLAVGYFGRDELTAARFVSATLGTDAEMRLYKTGDLARYLPDGRIEHLGRTDYQVKIRGFRIELEEIEVLLGHHPEVVEAVVLAREDEPGRKQLVAYVVFRPDAPDALERVRTYLQQKLPSYMVPAVFVVLDELPRLPNRKVNRHALPTPPTGRFGRADDFMAATSPDERLLAGIWSELLGLPAEQIDIHESFFELGGHSLLATQLVSRIRQAFRVELPLLAVFETPSISGLLQSILTAKLADAQDEMLSDLDDLDGLSEEEIEALLAAELAGLNE